MKMMPRTVHTIVFQAAEGGGNPCPVTLHADQLTTEEMQKMTKEFGFESVYLMAPTRTDCDIKARYFVPLHEMEMCIHATIGSSVVMAADRRCSMPDSFQNEQVILKTRLQVWPLQH